MRIGAFALLVAAASCRAIAQSSYTFEMRLIPDGTADAPSGPGTLYNIGDPTTMIATRVGFWLQARVAVSGVAQNWGIVRAGWSGSGTSYISVDDPSRQVSLSRGTVNAANSNFGRGMGYRIGGLATGNTGNANGSVPFPGVAGNENGSLDSGEEGGQLATRIHGFNAFVGVSRAALPGNQQPWNVNGAPGAGSPIPSDGTFSPWANLYRFWMDIPEGATFQTPLTLTASVYLAGSQAAAPTDASMTTWAMVLGPTQLVNTSYTLLVPSPGAAVPLVLGGVFAGRRRR